jgi:glutathione synthase/RimK-type ligase-like ATP-grasp enzyme
VRADGRGSYSYGKVEPVPLDDVPHAVLRNAVRAANRIGRGLYGVDLKYVGRRALVVEVNDNPNLDAGCEDAILGEELYAAIARSFRRRVDARRRR